MAAHSCQKKKRLQVLNDVRSSHAELIDLIRKRRQVSLTMMSTIAFFAAWACATTAYQPWKMRSANAKAASAKNCQTNCRNIFSIRAIVFKAIPEF